MDTNGSSESSQPEVWMRGPIAGIPALLQPVAHALLQAKEEIHELVNDFPDELLWQRPSGVASVGFHLQHIPGVLDRMFTYADGKPLSHLQLKYLSEEGLENEEISVISLLTRLDQQIDQSLEYLKKMDPSILTDTRTVGRKKYPSTVIGLLFHAADHTMRHTGQLLVTARIFENWGDENN